MEHHLLLEVVVEEEPLPYQVTEEVEALPPNQGGEVAGVSHPFLVGVGEEVPLPFPVVVAVGALLPFQGEEAVEVSHPFLVREAEGVHCQILEEEEVAGYRPFLARAVVVAEEEELRGLGARQKAYRMEYWHLVQVMEAEVVVVEEEGVKRIQLVQRESSVCRHHHLTVLAVAEEEAVGEALPRQVR